MTIKGLHDVLKRHNLKKSVRLCDKYANKRLAVDVSDWLHWAKYKVLKETGRVPTADDIVEACCDRVKLLLEHQAIPVLVFDGAAVPAKAETDARRRAQREEAQQAAEELRDAEDHEAANKKFTEALPVTHALALKFRQEVRSQWGASVEILVAPYEADAQLADLARRGDVDAVVTRDGDMLAYLVPRVLFNLSADGRVDELVLENVFAATVDGLSGPVDLSSWPDSYRRMWVLMCCLAGCDYVEKLAPPRHQDGAYACRRVPGRHDGHFPSA